MREQIAPLDDERPKRKFGGWQVGAGRPLGALNCITKDIKQGLLDGLLTCDYAFDDPIKNMFRLDLDLYEKFRKKHPENFLFRDR